MVALPTDVARSGAKERRAFETVLNAMLSVLERSLIANRPKGRDRHILAQSIAALSIGGMILARTVDDRALADELRASCAMVALDVGGWSRKTNFKGAALVRAATKTRGAKLRRSQSCTNEGRFRCREISSALIDLEFGPGSRRMWRNPAAARLIGSFAKCRFPRACPLIRMQTTGFEQPGS